MHALHNPRRPRRFGLFKKGGNVQQSAVEKKVISFPAARSANRLAFLEEVEIDSGRRMPFGLCLMIWAVLAVAGWGALDAMTRLI